jgi:chromosome segregation ATPase
LQAKIERLRAVEEAHLASSAEDAEQIAKLEAKIERLREALEEYAEPQNWTTTDCSDGFADTWNSFEHGYVIARDALNGGE